MALTQYCTAAVESSSSQAPQGKVAPHVEGAYQKLLAQRNPEGVTKWESDQKRRLLIKKVRMRRDTLRWRRSVTDPKVFQVAGHLQIPLMSRLICLLYTSDAADE